MNTSGISPIRVLRGKWLFLTLGLIGVISSSLSAAVLFTDNFDTYTNGTADANYTAAYNGPSGTTACLVASGTGLSSSKSVQTPGTTTDVTLIRKDAAINLASGTVTNSIFFQRVSAQIAAPQIGLMSELTGALNVVNSVGGRLNQFDQLDVRSSEGGVQSAVGTAVAVGVTLTNGNWYNLRTIITKTATTNQLAIVLQLWSSDPNGVVGTLIASNTQTATNASVWADTTLYAAVRLNNGSSGVSNLDNFSAIQVSASPTITLTGSLGAVDIPYGMASASPTSFQISGSNLAGAPSNLTVTPPSGFEVSLTNNAGYYTNLSVPYTSGTIASTNVYVRLAAATAVGTYSGNITVSGGGAPSQTIATASSTVSPAVVYPPPGYQLVWADEFNGTNLDTTKWGYENPGKWRDGFNTPNAVSVTNGLLTITTYTLNGTNFTCELNTYNKFTPKYGYMEASIDFNDSPGMWSGFWMYDYSVPTVGNPKTNGVEVDIIEHLAHNANDADVSNLGVSTMHWDGYSTQTKSVTSGNYNSSFATGFHTCALLWTPDSYTFIMDGVVVWTTTNAPPQDPTPPASPVSQTNQFLLLSSEVWNGNWVGTIPVGGFGSLATSTTKLKVDYVRYYQFFPDTNPPAVLIVTPTNGASLLANLSLQISATVTDNVAVAFAQLYLDGTNQPPAVTNAPYSFTVTNVSLGAHALKVVGQDTSGNRATNSANVMLVAPASPLLSNIATINGPQLSWSATGFTLQQASYCTGPWTNLVPPPTSPFMITPTNSAAFYRLRWSAP